MRVLIVKMSSLGDVIHTLPALTDAMHAVPGIRFDWVVEPSFQGVPVLHPAVDRVIPAPLRAWRKRPFSRETARQFPAFCKMLRAQQYDAVIDAQGLLKSALITRLCRGPRFGLDRHSAREPVAAFFYRHRISVPRQQHAIDRVRQLFSEALGFVLPETAPDYGIDRARIPAFFQPGKYLIFFHGTTWETKHWPEGHWRMLAKRAVQHGFEVRLPWGNAAERSRAERIAAECEGVSVLPALDLAAMASVLAGAQGVVSVDTGLGHLAAALGVPGVSLYGPTSPGLSGAVGTSQIHQLADFVCAPCFGRQCTFKGAAPTQEQPPCLAGISPELVWARLESVKE